MDTIQNSILEIDSEIASLEVTVAQKKARRASLVSALEAAKLIAVATPEEVATLQDKVDVAAAQNAEITPP